MSLVVLVDMDNVVADFDGRFRDLWAALHPESPLPERRHHRLVDERPPDEPRPPQSSPSQASPAGWFSSTAPERMTWAMWRDALFAPERQA